MFLLLQLKSISLSLRSVAGFSAVQSVCSRPQHTASVKPLFVIVAFTQMPGQCLLQLVKEKEQVPEIAVMPLREMGTAGSLNKRAV